MTKNERLSLIQETINLQLIKVESNWKIEVHSFSEKNDSAYGCFRLITGKFNKEGLCLSITDVVEKDICIDFLLECDDSRIVPYFSALARVFKEIPTPFTDNIKKYLPFDVVSLKSAGTEESMYRFLITPGRFGKHRV